MAKPESELSVKVITDAKSLYDNASRESFTQAEKRAALEVCVIRDSLDQLNGAVGWVPHTENPVDCLTKVHGNSIRMLQLMRTSRYKLTIEEDEMAARKAYRESTGKKESETIESYRGQHDYL